MNSEDLWIGDKVKLLKSGRSGIYEGMGKNDKARIIIDGKAVWSSYSNLKVLSEESFKSSLDINPIISKKKSTPQFFNEIDLHIEHLDPSLKNAVPQLILNKQVSTCRAFIGKVIEKGSYQITIIHGKGTGQLKSEVHHILQGIPEVVKYEVVNDEGATLVTLGYI